MKNKLLYIIFAALLLIVLWFSYKFFLLQKYQYILTNEIKSVLKFTDKIDIKHVDNPLNEEYRGLSFNVPERFVFNEANSNFSQTDGVGYNSYLLNYVDNQNYDAKLSVGNKVNLYHAFINNNVELIDLKGIDVKKIFKKYGITNNQALYEAIFRIYDNKVTVFSSSDDIKYNYLIKSLSNSIMSDAQYYQLTGDIQGYLLNSKDDIYEAHIFNGDKQIVISFWNIRKDVFNLETIQQFLSEIIIKNS